MNFELAINQLEQGEKVRRPSWEKDCYWELGVDAKICWKDGTTAHVHLNQIRADDWEIYKEKKSKLNINQSDILNYAKKFPRKWKNICDIVKKGEK